MSRLATEPAPSATALLPWALAPLPSAVLLAPDALDPTPPAAELAPVAAGAARLLLLLTWNMPEVPLLMLLICVSV
ncbi:hypothetical protein D3C81_2116120 [compost metagenome]